MKPSMIQPLLTASLELDTGASLTLVDSSRERRHGAAKATEAH